MRVLFVCLGNICRSPTAEAVFRSVVQRAGLETAIEIDSCGTAGYHVGEAPDPRSIDAASKRGYAMNALRGRQLCESDYHTYDYILPMDQANLDEVIRRNPGVDGSTIALLLSYSEQTAYVEVPDPYYGAGDGFSLVLDLIEDAAAGLLTDIKAKL